MNRVFLLVLLFALGSVSLMAAGLAADNDIVIQYSARNCDPAHADTLIMNLVDGKMIVQDLATGKLVFASEGNPEILPFPEELLSLHFSDSGKVYALTLKGVAELAGLSETLALLRQNKLGTAATTSLKDANIAMRRPDYRLFVDKNGNFGIWNIGEALFMVFAKDGASVASLPCQNNPIMTGNDSFVSAFFDPSRGSRLIEIGFKPPVENGMQKETNGMFVELQNKNVFKILSFDSANGTARGILMPAESENADLTGVEVSETDAEAAAKAGLSQTSIESEAAAPSSENLQEFIDPANPGNIQTFYCSVDKSGAVKKLASMSGNFSADRVVEHNKVLYHLIPEYQSANDEITLVRLLVKKSEISE